jgi:ABC-type transport system involved in multi-copper enzyme maturation permease subunit
MSSTANSEVVPSRLRPSAWLPRSDAGRLLLEWLLLAIALGEGVALLWGSAALGPGLRVLLWGQWLLLAASLLGLAGLSVFGPVFFYDLVRLTRRGRYFLIRVVYVLALFFLIWCIWSSEAASRGGSLTPSQMAEFANQVFFVFVAVQLGVVVLLTPAYTAGAIAEEKERRTLEFVLATDLGDRELVLGKLGSRLINLLFVVLAGLPVLAVMQLLGGVDPGLLAAAFAATALTMLSLAAVSMLFSTLVRRSRDAIVLAYLAFPTYMLVGGCLYLFLLPGGGNWGKFPSTAAWTSPVTVADLVEWFNAGNLVRALVRVGEAYGGNTLGADLADILGRYALFHGLVTAVCCVAAVRSVRRVALNEVSTSPARGGRARRGRRLPPVGTRPMVWKEMHAERGVRLHWLGQVFIVLLVGASFLPLWPIWEEFDRGRGQFFAEQMNVWVRGVGTPVACLLLLGVAVRAASSVSGERDRQTFDALLTTPLESRDILYAKWLASVFSMRWIWLWLGAIWLLGVISGGLSPIAVPLLAGAWFAFASFVAAVGLWFSTVCRGSLRATLCTLFTLVVVWGAHWLIWMVCIPLFIAAGPPGREMEDVLPRVIEFQAFTLCPPGTLGFLAFREKDFAEGYNSYQHTNWAVEFLVCSLLGVGLWSAAAAMVWSATVDRFNAVTGRTVGPKPVAPRRSAGPAPGPEAS